MKDHVALMVRDGEQFLFIQRAATKKKLPNIWAFPSGTVEEGEKPELTAVREAKEELGIEVEVEKLVPPVELPELDTRLHFIVCGITSGFPSLCEPAEIRSLRWMTFPEFFSEYSDDQIGHGLVHLRQHPELWRDLL